MNIRTWFAAGLILWMSLTGSLSVAQKGKGKEHKESRTVGDGIREVLPPSEILFTQEERTLVVGWFRNNGSGLPPGLAKRNRLPPGLEKQLRERGTLPPGLQKKLAPVPVALEQRLRVLPTGYRRVVIGGNIILLDERTAFIYDVIRNVIP